MKYLPIYCSHLKLIIFIILKTQINWMLFALILSSNDGFLV